MRELGLNPSKAELEDLVNEADTNKDGVINFEEFLNLMSQSVKETDSEKELLEAFRVFDKDNSGTISTEELRAVLKSLGEDMTDADVDEMIKLADKNGDGQIDCESLLFSFLFYEVDLLFVWVGARRGGEATQARATGSIDAQIC